jgi:hypothetical protein
MVDAIPFFFICCWLQTITTPKKSAGLTRDTSRVSLASAGGQSPDLVSSTLSPVRALYPIDTEFITNQTPPDQLAEQQIEGLREEVNKLQVGELASV